jgi:hypothetical protein
MSIKQKFMSIITAHPKLLTIAVGLAITVAVGTAIGMTDQSHLAHAFECNCGNNALGQQ